MLKPVRACVPALLFLTGPEGNLKRLSGSIADVERNVKMGSAYPILNAVREAKWEVSLISSCAFTSGLRRKDVKLGKSMHLRELSCEHFITNARLALQANLST